MSESPQDLEAQRRALQRFATEQIEAAGEYLRELKLLPPDAKARGAWGITDVVFLSHFWSAANPELAYWVIGGGEFPNDHTEFSVATEPREAVRRFALSWQLQSERTKEFAKDDASMDWEGAAKELALRAEQLYALTEDDALWPSRDAGTDTAH